MASTDKSNLPPAPVQTVDRDWVDPTTKPAQSLDRVIQGMEGAYGVKSTPGATGGDAVGMAYGLPQKNALFTPTDFMGTAGKTPMDPYTPGVNLAPQFGSKGTGSGSGSSSGGGKGTVVPGMSLEHPTFDTEAGVPMTLPTDAKNASRYLQAGGDVDAVLSSRLGRLVTTTAQAAWNLGKETLFDLMETLDNLDNPRKVGWLGVANVIDWADDPGGIPSWLAGKAARGAVAAASLYPKATSAVVDLVGSGIEGATGAKRTTDIGLEWLKAVAGPTEGFDRGEAVEAMGRALWDAAASGELSALAQRQSSMSAGFYGPALQRSLKTIGMDRAFMTEDGRFATIYGRDLVNASVPKEMALKLAATASSEHERAMWYMLSTDGGREVLGAALDILIDPLWLAGPATASKVVTIGEKAYRVSTTVLRASRVLEGTEHAADAIRVATRAALGEADAVAALTDAAAALARDAATARKQAGELKAMTAAELQARVADDVKQAQEALNQMVAAYGQAGGATPAELAALRGTLGEAQQELLRIAGNPERYRKAAMAAQLQAASRLEGAVGAARQVLKGAAQVKREGLATVHWGERSYSMIPGKATDFLVEKVGAPLERSIAPWTFGQLQAKALAGGGPEALTVGERMAWTVHTLHTDLGKLGGNLRRLPSASWAFLSSVLGTRYFQPWVMAAQDYMKMLGRGDAAAMERLADQLVAGGELIALKGVSPETWDNYQKALGAYFDALGARDHFIRSSMSRAVRTASEIHALRKTLAIQWEKEGKPATVTHKGKVYRVDPAWGRAEYTAQDVFDEALRHAESGDGMLEARPELRPMAAAFRQFVTELQQQTGKEAGELEQALIRVIRSYKEGMEPEKLEAVRAMLAFAVEQKESVHTALASSRLQQLYDLQNDQHQLELVLETLDDVLGKGGLSKLLKAAAGQTDDMALTERLVRMLEDQGIQRVKAEEVSKRIIKSLKTATNQKTLEDALEFAARIAEPVQPVEHVVDAPVLAGVRQAREEYEAMAREVEELLASDDLDPARLVKLRASALRGLQREVAAWEKAILSALEDAKTPEALAAADKARAGFATANEALRAGKIALADMAGAMKDWGGVPEALRGKVIRLAEQREKALGKLQEAHAFWQEEIEILKVWEKNQSAGRKLLQLTDLGYALRNVPEADIPAMVQKALRGMPPDPAVLAAVKRGSAKEVMDALQAQRKAVAEGIKGSKEAQRALEAELNAQRKAYIEATEAVDKLKADLDAVEMGTVWEAPTRTANQMNINERVRRQANELERAMWQRALTIRGTASEEDWLLAAFSLLGEAQRFPDQVGNLGRRVGALPDEMQGLVSEVRTIVGQYEEWYGKTGFDFPADPVQRLKEWGVALYVPHIAPEAELAGKGNRASQTWARGSGQGGHSATDRLMNTNIPGRRQRVLAGTLDEINAASLGHSIESSPQRILARYIAVNRAITGAEFAQALLRGEVLVKLEPQVMDDVIVAADGTSQTVKRLVEGGSVEDQALAQGLFPLFDRPNKTRDLDILLQGSAEDWARIGVTVEEVREAVAALRRPSNTDATPFMSWLRSGTEQQSMANVMAIVLHMRAEGMGRVPGGRDVLWTVEDALDSYLSQGLSRQSALRAVTQDLNKVASEAGLSQIGEEALRAFTEDKPWRLFVPARIQQSMEHVFSPLIARNGGVLSKLLYGLKDTNDLFQNFWKTWTTITATAFHSKNIMSNKLVEIMNGGLWGALSPARNMTANSLAAAAGYKETYGSIEQAVAALREAGGPRWAFFKRSAIYKLWEQGIDLGDGVVRPLDDALDLLEEHGVQTRGFTGIGNLDEYEEAISDWAYTWRHNPLKAAWKAAKDWGPDAVMASLIYGGIGLPGMAVFLPRKFGAAAGRRLESVSRLTMFMTQLETVGNVEEAAARVQKYLFNYDDLTEVQKVWVRSLFPFFTWTQKNLLIQLEMLREAPWQFGKLHQILGVELPRISDALDQNPIANPIDANDPEQRKNLRQDQRGKYMVPLPLNDWYGKQAPIYLTNFATPQESALDLVNQLWSGDVAGYFGPLSKLAYAYLSGQDPYSGKAWESETNGAKIAQQLTILKRAGELPGIGLLFRGMHAALSEGLGISIIAPSREYDPLQRVVQNPRAAFVYGQLNPWGRVVNQLCAYLDAYQVAWHTPVSELEGSDFRVPGLLRWLRSVTGLGFTFYDPWQGDRAYERALRDEQIRIGVELGGLDKSEIPRSH